MKPDLLDIVFEENEVEYLDRIGVKVGSREKRTKHGVFGGEEREVVYSDAYGNVTGYAREEGFRNKCVQFYDKDGNPTIRARSYEKFNGQIVVEYFDKNGKTISERYADKDKIFRNTPHTMEDDDSLTKKERGEKEGGNPDLSSFINGGKGCVTVGVIIFVVFFIIFAVAKLLQNPLISLHANYYTVVKVVRAYCLYISGPLALIYAVLRTGKAFRNVREVRAFEILHIILCAAAMGVLSFLLNKVVVYLGDTVSGWNGVLLYALGYAPLVAFVLISRIMFEFWKRDTQIKGDCRIIGVRFVKPVTTFGAVSIFLARITMRFGMNFDPAIPGYFIMRVFWQAILALLIVVIIRLIYKD